MAPRSREGFPRPRRDRRQRRPDGMDNDRIDLLRREKRISPQTAASFRDLVGRGVTDPCLEADVSPGVVQEWLLFAHKRDNMPGIGRVERILLAIKDHHSHRILQFVTAMRGESSGSFVMLDTHLSDWLAVTQRRDVLECVLWKWLDTAGMLGEDQRVKDTRVKPCAAIEAAADPCRLIQVLASFADQFHTRMRVCEAVDDIAIRNGWWTEGDLKRSCAMTFDATLRTLQRDEYTNIGAVKSKIHVHAVDVEEAVSHLVARGALDTIDSLKTDDTFFTLPRIKRDALTVQRLAARLVHEASKLDAWGDFASALRGTSAHRTADDAPEATTTHAHARTTDARRSAILSLNPEQLSLVRRVCEGNRLTTCCSPPGTGKTFSSRVMASFATCVLGLAFTHQALEKLALEVRQSASDATSKATSWTFMTVQKFVVLHDARKTGTVRSSFTDLVIVDECSMGTMSQIRTLFEVFVDTRARVVLLGDFNQLPPIGRGAPFRDIVTTMGCNVQLRTSMRSNVQGVLTACADILEGKVPTGDAPGFTLHDDSADPLRALKAFLDARQMSTASATQTRTAKSANGLRIITHTRAHVRAVNELMQERAGVVKGRAFRGSDSQKCYVGDLVRCTANTNAYTNGTTGVLVDVVQRERVLEASVEGGRKKKRYRKKVPVAIVRLASSANGSQQDFVDVDEYHIEPSYAVTAHKSQGSEYEEVVLLIFLSDVHAVRELFYTAASRARQQLHIVGHVDGLRGSKRDDRLTLLGLVGTAWHSENCREL